MTGGPAFVLRDVGHRVGDATILDGVSATVPYGRLLAVVGPNGAGKSSLLGVLAGDLRPTAGAVALDGRALSGYDPRELARRRSVLLQSHEVSFSFTAREVVEMGRAPWIGRPEGAHDEERLRDALVLADVAHLAARVFSSLSGGERARVSLARVLAQDAAIVLLDEPTAALDLRHQEETLRLARDLAHGPASRAVVVVLHDLSLAAAYADDVAMLDAGRLVAHGPPQAVLAEERIEAVYGIRVRIVPDPDTGRPVVLPRRG